MEEAKHRRVTEMRDPPGQGAPFEGGSATSRKLSRSADSSEPSAEPPATRSGEGPGRE